MTRVLRMLTADRRKPCHAFCIISMALTSVAAGSTAYAQETAKGGLDVVVVTAERREENANRLPTAVSAFDEETLEAAGVDGVLTLTRLAPSLQIGTNSAQNFLSIRGIGMEVFNIGAESGVAVSQDGVVLARQILFDVGFMDIARVEVLRGPQGTISGRNATGGAINIYANLPTEESEADIAIEAGNYQHLQLDAHISGPIAGSSLLGRGAIRISSGGDWLRNLSNGQKLGGRDSAQGRVSLVAEPMPDVKATLIIDALSDNSNAIFGLYSGRARPDRPSPAEFLGVPAPDLRKLTFQEEARRDYSREQYGASLTVDWAVGKSAKLKAVTGWVTADFTDSYGDSLRGQNVEFPQFGYEIDQLSQELTLTADLGDRFDVIVGGLHLDERSAEPLEFVAPLIGLTPGLFVTRPEQDLESWAAYAQLRVQATDQLRISAGVRYTSDSKTYRETTRFFGSGGGNASWDAWTPRVAIDYQISDEIVAYASAARGFKAGGFNTFNFAPTDIFNPETVWNYEAGLKGDFLDRRLRLATAAFHSDYSDLQQTIFGSSFLPSVANAAKATISGAEIEFDALIDESWTLGGNLTYLDATFDKLSSADPLFPELGVRNLAGNRLARSPRLQANISVQHETRVFDGLKLQTRMSYDWQDSQFFDFFNHDRISQGAYGVLDASIRLEDPSSAWRVELMGQNLLDERYAQNIGLATTLPGAPTRFLSLGTPRTYGIRIGHAY